LSQIMEGRKKGRREGRKEKKEGIMDTTTKG
jgi:hypothetical protein